MLNLEAISNPYLFYPTAFIISFSGVLIPGPMTAVSIAKGFKEKTSGFKIAIGHGLVEVPLILLIYFGFSGFFEDSSSLLNRLISLLGGGMLVYMGGAMFKFRTSIIDEGKDLSVSALGAGILTTGGNPSFFIWWATAGVLLVSKSALFGPFGVLLFILVHEAADLLWYGLLGYGTYKSKHLMTPRFQEILFGVLALLLIGFGLVFITTVLT